MCLTGAVPSKQGGGSLLEESGTHSLSCLWGCSMKLRNWKWARILWEEKYMSRQEKWHEKDMSKRHVWEVGQCSMWLGGRCSTGSEGQERPVQGARVSSVNATVGGTDNSVKNLHLYTLSVSCGGPTFCPFPEVLVSEASTSYWEEMVGISYWEEMATKRKGRQRITRHLNGGRWVT